MTTYAYGGDPTGLAGKYHYGNGALGILGSLIPASGVDGPGYGYECMTLPADLASEMYFLITSLPGGVTISTDETTGFTLTAVADGVYPIPFDAYKFGVYQFSTHFDAVFGDVVQAFGASLSRGRTISAGTVTRAMFDAIGANLSRGRALSAGAVTVTPGPATINAAGANLSRGRSITPGTVDVLPPPNTINTAGAPLTRSRAITAGTVTLLPESDRMGAVAIMRALLVAYVPLTTLVPAPRIFAGKIPQGALLPAIAIEEVSGHEISTLSRLQNTTLNRSRVQVTVVAKNLRDQKRIMGQAKLGPGVHRGTYAGFKTLSVLPDSIGPDMNNLDDDGIYEQSRDFVVTFVEAN